jgi:hypothetical protein
MVFSAWHALSCAKGGLVVIRHNELCDELGNVVSKAFSPTFGGLQQTNNQRMLHRK